MAYRYLHEGMIHVLLDGTLIECDRVAGVRENGNNLWFSQKHRAFGGNVQFLPTPDGTPLRASEAEPGSAPDITAARIRALCKTAADDLPTLEDKRYIGAGIGILIPVRRPRPVRAGTARGHANHEQPHQSHPRTRRTGRRRSLSSAGAPCSTSVSPSRPRPQQNLEVITAEKMSVGTSLPAGARWSVRKSSLARVRSGRCSDTRMNLLTSSAPVAVKLSACLAEANDRAIPPTATAGPSAPRHCLSPGSRTSQRPVLSGAATMRHVR
ncbi:transposase family protein [Actinomadura verrucosospora]|uniref:transposase family protein n=1 Tax=Actinomadura verrucosospora TaxID=46165 RepID=UPI00156495D5|nr:transposase family protein [Actinomadura verrucosospora]